MISPWRPGEAWRQAAGAVKRKVNFDAHSSVSELLASFTGGGI
jgi:hypothetical protein